VIRPLQGCLPVGHALLNSLWQTCHTLYLPELMANLPPVITHYKPFAGMPCRMVDARSAMQWQANGKAV